MIDHSKNQCWEDDCENLVEYELDIRNHESGKLWRRNYCRNHYETLEPEGFDILFWIGVPLPEEWNEDYDETTGGS